MKLSLGEALLRCKKNDHEMVDDPPHVLSTARRHTCKKCGKVILIYASNVYGSALEEACSL